MMNVFNLIRFFFMCEIGELTRTCGAATPGIVKLYIIDVDDVVSIPSANSAWTITTNIILKAGKFWKDIPFVEQKAGLSDEIADAVGGGFKKNLPMKLSKYSPQTNKWINQAIGARFIALVADNNGQIILIGDKIGSMRLEKATGTTGQKSGDENGWDMNLTSEGVKPAYFYTGAIVLQGATVSFDTPLTFASSRNANAFGVAASIAVGAENAVQKLEYNKRTETTELSVIMSIRVGGVEKMTVTLDGDYVGDSFRYTHTDGAVYESTFAEGNVLL